jgi:hypothetical protein
LFYLLSHLEIINNDFLDNFRGIMKIRFQVLILTIITFLSVHLNFCFAAVPVENLTGLKRPIFEKPEYVVTEKEPERDKIPVFPLKNFFETMVAFLLKVKANF